MSRKEKPTQSFVTLDTMQTHHLQTVLAKFFYLFTSCAGPEGKVHMVRNTKGGHVTMTGNCGRLLGAILLSRPELKLLATSVQAHLHRHEDGGLFLLHICSHLIMATIRLEMKISVVPSLFGVFVDKAIDYLKSSECGVRVSADFTDLSVLLVYVKSVLRTKSLLNFSQAEHDHLSQLIVRTFLESLPSEIPKERASDGTFHVLLDNMPVSNCKLESGLLLRHPELSIIHGPQKLKVHRMPFSLTTGSHDSETSCIKVSLFTCSLSGDMEETVDGHFELTEEQNAAMESAVLQGLLAKMCDTLGELGVGLLLCQRVLHPSIKAKLRAMGILFMERLGSQPIAYIQDLTGAAPIRSVVDLANLEASLGWLSSLEHVVLSEKSFLWLQRTSSPVSSLILCASWEEKLEELQKCVRACLLGLSHLAQSKVLLCGAGCWQVHCAAHLRAQVTSELSTLAGSHHCSETVILQALSIFCGSLQSWAHTLARHSGETMLVDPVAGHVWRMPQDVSSEAARAVCCCGLKSAAGDELGTFDLLSQRDEPRFSKGQKSSGNVDISTLPSCVRVLDSFTSSVDALRQAITTSALMLSVGLSICDNN